MNISAKQVLGAIIIVLIIVIVCRVASKKTGRKWCGLRKRRDGFHDRMLPGEMTVRASLAPYAAIQNSIDAVRGNPDARDILQQGRPALKAYMHSSAELKPEDLMAAERAAWVVAAEQDRVAPFNIEKMTNAADDTMQHFETAPAIDYQTMVTDLVVDPRTRMNHAQWVDEMKGWSGTTTMKVDRFEPQLYLNWQGLRMPQAGVGQYNPLQLTEVDDTDLAVNRPFNFNG